MRADLAAALSGRPRYPATASVPVSDRSHDRVLLAIAGLQQCRLLRLRPRCRRKSREMRVGGGTAYWYYKETKAEQQRDGGKGTSAIDMQADEGIRSRQRRDGRAECLRFGTGWWRAESRLRPECVSKTLSKQRCVHQCQLRAELRITQLPTYYSNRYATNAPPRTCHRPAAGPCRYSVEPRRTSTMRRPSLSWAATGVFIAAVAASQPHSFSIHDDLLAFPQVRLSARSCAPTS